MATKTANSVVLSVKQPMKFEFVIDFNAVDPIGLTLPPNVRVRADKVIR